MYKVAYIIGDRFLYWSPILIGLGVLAAVCMFLSLHLSRTGKATGAFVAVPLALGLSLLMGRLICWICTPGSYDSLDKALADFSTKDIALAGAFMGCVIAACLVRLAGLTKELPTMLDAMSLAGLFGIAVGRLSCFFNTAGRSALPGENQEMPIFLYQIVVCAVLFVVLLAFFLTLGRKRPGDTCLLFCLFYGASQAVLDGIRYDALYLPFLQGLSLAELAGILMMVLVTALLSWKLIRVKGWKWWYLALWIPFVGFVRDAAVLLHGIRGVAGSLGNYYMASALLCAAAAVALMIYTLLLFKKQVKIEKT